MKITTVKTEKENIGKAISILFFILGIIFFTFYIFAMTYDKPIIIDGEVMNEIDGVLISDIPLKEHIGTLIIIGVIFMIFQSLQKKSRRNSTMG